MLTVISHFYNESFLLPYWLRHHRNLFDHGIMIDYDSTDNSVEIIKELCPTWDIFKSRNNIFDANACDEEVISFEIKIKDWKVTLNITEFLFIKDLNYYLKGKNYNGITTQGIIMVDSTEERYKEIIEQPLFLQRTFGFEEPPHGYLQMGRPSRSRLIHKMPHGMYGLGRHFSHMQNTFFDKDLFLLWFGFCPYEKIKFRKQNMSNKFPKDYNIEQFKEKHWHESFLKYQKMSYNLLEIPAYKEVFDAYNNMPFL